MTTGYDFAMARNLAEVDIRQAAQRFKTFSDIDRQALRDALRAAMDEHVPTYTEYMQASEQEQS